MSKNLSLFPEFPNHKKGPKLKSDYSSVIVSFSTGVDSAGALYWAVKNFPIEKIWLLYCDTGLEYDINHTLFRKTGKILGIPKERQVLLRHPEGFIGILERRKMWPDMKNRWCTSYLKTDIINKWIRKNRHRLGTSCLFVTGERRDESPRRAKMDELVYHSTHLKTKKVADFTCHWMKPVLDYDKGKMFEWAKEINLEIHPCYEYLNRCSCMACMFMPDLHAVENMKRHPNKFRKLIQKEIEYGHTWKKDISLKELWEIHCEDVPLDIVA